MLFSSLSALCSQRQSQHRRSETQGEILQLQLQTCCISVRLKTRRVHWARSRDSKTITRTDPDSSAPPAVYQHGPLLSGRWRSYRDGRDFLLAKTPTYLTQGVSSNRNQSFQKRSGFPTLMGGSVGNPEHQLLENSQTTASYLVAYC